jgi:hypothetical protein
LTIVADPQVKSYGSADPVLTYAASGFQFADSPAAILSGALARTLGEGVAGSPYPISQGTLVANANYTINFTTNALTINPVPLFVTADIKTKVYGAADPPLTVAYAGFVNAESPSVLAGSLVVARAPGQNVGDYPITPGGLTSANYTISFIPGFLSVTRAPLSVTADVSSKTYGAADPAFSVSYSGFVNGDSSSALGGVLTFSRPPGENVGNYSITPGGLTGSNYAITFNNGTLKITAASLSLTTDARTKTYGAADPALTFTVSGLQFSDNRASVFTGALARALGETVAGSPYAITQGTLAANSNYSISFTGSTLTITPAILSITGQAKTKTYGVADPALTFGVSGLQFSDSQASVLTGALARAPGETVAGSPYAISPGTLTANSNYTISFIGNSLSITPATISITAQARTKTYGTADPTLTFTVSGLQFSDTQASVLNGALARLSGETVVGGPYAITQGTLAVNTNYTINFSGSALTIAPAPLSVTAEAKTKTFGTADPVFTVTYVGFVNGETQSVLSGTLVITRAPGETVGAYLITPGGLTSANYSIIFNTATLTITPPAPVVFPLVVTTSNVLITWNSVSNATYRVQYKSPLNAPNWTDLGGDVLATGSTASKIDIFTPTNRFYRVQVIQ